MNIFNHNKGLPFSNYLDLLRVHLYADPGVDNKSEIFDSDHFKFTLLYIQKQLCLIKAVQHLVDIFIVFRSGSIDENQYIIQINKAEIIQILM